MQNGMITTQLTPHNTLYFVPTSEILIPPFKSGKTRRRLARRLGGRQVCRLGRGGGAHKASMLKGHPHMLCIAATANFHIGSSGNLAGD